MVLIQGKYVTFNYVTSSITFFIVVNLQTQQLVQTQFNANPLITVPFAPVVIHGNGNPLLLVQNCNGTYIYDLTLQLPLITLPATDSNSCPISRPTFIYNENQTLLVSSVWSSNSVPISQATEVSFDFMSFNLVGPVAEISSSHYVQLSTLFCNATLAAPLHVSVDPINMIFYYTNGAEVVSVSTTNSAVLAWWAIVLIITGTLAVIGICLCCMFILILICVICVTGASVSVALATICCCCVACRSPKATFVVEQSKLVDEKPVEVYQTI